MYNIFLFNNYYLYLYDTMYFVHYLTKAIQMYKQFECIRN